VSLIERGIRIYVCPSKHRPANMAFNRSLCGECGVWREPVDLVPEPQLAGAVEALRWAMARITPPELDDPSPSAAAFAQKYAKAKATLDALGGQ
jgi:hypothetical protein